MTKVAAKAKVGKEIETKDAPHGLSWIPAVPAGTASEKKNDLNVSTILEVKHVSSKIDKFGRSCVYFVCKNPDGLNILKEHIDSVGLNMEALALPFWQGDEGAVMLRVGAQNCGLSGGQLAESSLAPIRAPCDFKYYSGKTKSGFSIHISKKYVLHIDIYEDRKSVV